MRRVQDIEEEAANWIARRDGRQWNAQGQRSLDAWLAESPLHRVAYLRLDAAWQRADRLRVLHASLAPGFVRERFEPKLARWAPGGRRALLALAASVAALALPLISPGLPGTLEVTEIGARRSVPFPDGSRVTLNTLTRLRTDVAPSRRRVWVDEGEAYFEVARDEQHPFEVLAGRRRITVLGTRFTVRRTGERVQVAVLEGRVAVSAEQAGEAFTLSAGDTTVSLEDNTQLFRREPARLAAELGWLDGKLVFDHVTLAQAAAEFNRYNRRQITIADPKSANIVIGGTFGATNVEAFARLLQSSFGLEVSSGSGSVITVRGEGLRG